MKHFLSTASALKPILRLAYLTLLLTAWGTQDAAAQQPDVPANTLSVRYNQVALTGGGNSGQFYQATLSRRFHSRLRASLGVGYLTSVNRGCLYLIEGSDAWRDRKHVVADLSGHVDALRFRAGRISNRLGVKAGFSYRYRWEDRWSGTFYPIYFEGRTEEVLREILAVCGDSGIYCFTFDDGLGGEQDGQYVALTYYENRSDVGALAALEYGLGFGRVEVGLEAGYYRYLKQPLSGTHTAYYGLSAGYRF